MDTSKALREALQHIVAIISPGPKGRFHRLDDKLFGEISDTANQALAAAPASPAGSEESICPRCMGTGEYGATLGGARPCAVCHGTGKITPDIANESPAGSGASERCPECGEELPHDGYCKASAP